MLGRILIVDDDANARLNFRIALQTEGYEILEAGSAAQALGLFAQASFALAILDMRMPHMDGLSLLAKMRENGISTPTVIVSAFGDVSHAVKAMKLGAIDFLQKPLRPEDLRNAVAEIKNCQKDDRSSESFEAHLAAAKRCLNLHAFALARLHLATALKLNAKSVEAFNLAGVLAEVLEEYQDAKKYYGQAIRLDKTYEPAQQNMRRLFEVDQFGSSNEPVNLGDE
jgi:two-component system OmpR family response regulator